MTDPTEAIREARQNVLSALESLKKYGQTVRRYGVPSDIRRNLHHSARNLKYALNAMAVQPQSSADFQQRHSAGWDIVDEAISAYDEWMLEDDYQFQKILAKIIERMRERRSA